MKKIFLISLAVIFLSSCAPVLSPELMKTGILDIRLSDVKANPGYYKGRLFILGGIIVKTKIIEEGSLVEVIHVPVNSWGYLKGVRASRGRFLALYRSKEILDPLIFREKREITLAGEFIGTRTGKIGDMDYVYPFFEIRELYLWEEEEEIYYIGPPYPSRYYPPWWYDPWWRYY